MDFAFEVVRLWEVPVDKLLHGGLATLPFAVLAKLPEGLAEEPGLIDVVQSMLERFEREGTSAQAGRLLTAAYVLSGLRVPRAVAMQIFKGVQAMRESATYQAILDEGRDEGRKEGRKEGLKEGLKEGRVEELHRVLLRLGRKRFGEPDEATRKALKQITDVGRLEMLSERLLEVGTWSELLQ